MPRQFVLKPDKRFKKLNEKDADRYLTLIILFLLFLVGALLTIIFF